MSKNFPITKHYHMYHVIYDKALRFFGPEDHIPILQLYSDELRGTMRCVCFLVNLKF